MKKYKPQQVVTLLRQMEVEMIRRKLLKKTNVGCEDLQPSELFSAGF